MLCQGFTVSDHVPQAGALAIDPATVLPVASFPLKKYWIRTANEFSITIMIVREKVLSCVTSGCNELVAALDNK